MRTPLVWRLAPPALPSTLQPHFSLAKMKMPLEFFGNPLA